jgi:hypothetical protein
VIIGLFEAIKTITQTLANNLTKLLDQYGLRNKIITYVKDEGSNLYSMAIVLKFVVKCEVLGLDESFQSSCFGHVLSKMVNMLLLPKQFVEISSLFQSSLPSQICKNV